MIRIIKLLHQGFSCVRVSQLPPTLQPALWVYKSSNKLITISQSIEHPQDWGTDIFPNFFIARNKLIQEEKAVPNLFEIITKKREFNGKDLQTLYRVLLTTNLGENQLSIDINSIKKDKYLSRIIQLLEAGRLQQKKSQILIDDKIQEKQGFDLQKKLPANIMYLEKMIQTGLHLSVSYLISNKNVACSQWIKMLSKKRKAIDSNIVEKICLGGQNKNLFEQFVYNNGYRLQHLFLRSYKNGLQVSSLQDNESYSIEQLLKVLAIIDFEGKLILENNQQFYENINHLDKALKKCGFHKKNTGEVDFIDQFLIF